MIIQHNTSKAELCFVKVDNDAFDFNVFDGNELFFKSTMNGAFSKVNPFYRTLPEGNWQIVANPFELSEGQCKGLAVRSDRHPDLELYIDHTADSTRYAYLLKSAKASFNSLLNHLKIYQTNPFPDPELTMRQGDGYVYYGASDEEFAEYEEAEERTGSFILLKKI